MLDILTHFSDVHKDFYSKIFPNSMSHFPALNNNYIFPNSDYLAHSLHSQYSEIRN
jgi:hypothetical protein